MSQAEANNGWIPKQPASLRRQMTAREMRELVTDRAQPWE
jgi:hypothetical protein